MFNRYAVKRAKVVFKTFNKIIIKSLIWLLKLLWQEYNALNCADKYSNCDSLAKDSNCDPKITFADGSSMKDNCASSCSSCPSAKCFKINLTNAKVFLSFINRIDVFKRQTAVHERWNVCKSNNRWVTFRV